MLKQDVIYLIQTALSNMNEGEIFVPMLPSVKVLDLIDVLVDDFCNKNNIKRSKIKYEYIENKWCENQNEKLVSSEEVQNVVEYQKHYVIKKTKQNTNGFAGVDSSANLLQKKDIFEILSRDKII